VNELNILVVDDNEDFVEIVTEYITSCQPKANVRSVENGYLAQVELKSTKYDFLITDFDMPVCNGLDLIKYVRTLRASQRPKEILLLSAFIEEGEPDPNLKNIIFMPKENYLNDLKPLLKSVKDVVNVDNGKINLTGFAIEGDDYMTTDDKVHVDIIGENFVEVARAKGISQKGLVIFATPLLKSLPEGKEIDCLLSFSGDQSMKTVARVGNFGSSEDNLLGLEFTEISDEHRGLLSKLLSDMKSDVA